MIKVRAKFKCVKIERTMGAGQEMQTICLAPVYSTDEDDENAKFWKYTPSGRIELGTVNKAAGDNFELDREYYIDFTRAE